MVKTQKILPANARENEKRPKTRPFYDEIAIEKN